MNRALMAGAALTWGAVIAVLLAMALRPDAPTPEGQCAPVIAVVSIGPEVLRIPFGERLSVSPVHRAHLVHSMKTPKGRAAYCAASDGGTSSFIAASAYLFSKSPSSDAICPHAALEGFCTGGAPNLRRLLLSDRTGDALAQATTAELFEKSRAADPWKSNGFVEEAGGAVLRYADEFRRFEGAGGARVAQCWPVGALLQCDVSAMLNARLRLEWTILAPANRASADLLAADARAEAFVAAARVR